MKKQDFRDFYNEVITKAIEDIFANAHNLLSPLGVDENSVINERRNAGEKIFNNYQKKRDFIKLNYMELDKSGSDESIALDRHKVAACMVYAILKSCPLKIRMLTANLPEEVVMANEFLAFGVAVNIIEMYIKAKNGGDDFAIKFPSTYYEGGNAKNRYPSNVCKAWYYLKLDNIEKFDIFGYANVFFLWERYTELYQETKNGKDMNLLHFNI